MFELMGKYGPALGLTATLVGQVVMFKNMARSLPAAATAGAMAAVMAAAAVIRRRASPRRCRFALLLGTLYGTVWANLICGPLFDKLSIRSKEELFNKQIVIQGILAIQAGDNPRIVESKLLSFLSPKERAGMAAAGGGKDK